RARLGWLGGGRSTRERYGRGSVLWRLGRDAPGGESLVRAARERGVPLEVVTIEAPDVLQAYERALVLVRPDGHVAWRADAEPADAGAIIDRARGVLPSAGAQAMAS